MGDVFKATADRAAGGQRGLVSTRQAVYSTSDVLEEAGLITTRRQGRCKLHHLDTAPLHVIVDRWLTSPGKDRA